MEMVVAILLLILAVAFLGLLAWAWMHHVSEGGFWNFWMAWTLADVMGHVLTFIFACLASIFNSDS